jgi:hypothetical protein
MIQEDNKGTQAACDNPDEAAHLLAKFDGRDDKRLKQSGMTMIVSQRRDNPDEAAH